MALQNVEILNAMQTDLGQKIKTLRVDGGATQNQLLMQLQADYLGVNLLRPQNIETTSLGAAYMAGLGVGLWGDLRELEKVWQLDQEFKCQMQAKNRKERLAKWSKVVATL
jgi:glycerol kinase